MKRMAWLVLLLSGGAVAHAADLLDVYHEAQHQDAVYASARAAYAAAKEALPQGRALLLPTIGLSANTTYNRSKTAYRGATSLSGGAREYNSNGYTLSLSQPVFRLQNFAQYKQAKAQVRQAGAEFAIAAQSLILRVAQAYFDVLLAQDNVALAAAQKAAIAEQLAQAKRNFEVGTATITDTNDAQARYDLVNAQEIAAKNTLEVKKRTLQQMISALPPPLAPLSGKLPLTFPRPDNMRQWAVAAENQNLQLQVQRAALAVAQDAVKINRAGHYPTLDLVASYNDSSQGGGSFGVGSDVKSRAIGLQLNLPLFEGGAVSAKVRQAVDNVEKARQDMENARRQAVLQAQQSFLGVTSGVAQVKALAQALISNRTSLASTKLGREVGVRTSVDVLNAQQQLYSAKRDLWKARYDYIMSQLKLKAAVGTLGEKDVIQVNRWLVHGTR